MSMTFTEGSGLNDSVFGKSQAPIRMFLEKRGEAYERDSVARKLFQMGKSSHYAEKLTALTAMDGFAPVGENGEYPSDSMREGYSKELVHMTWKDKFAVSREILDDANTLELRRRPAQFIAGYYRTREKFGAALYGGAIRGESSISFAGQNFDVLGADGQPLFSKTHPALIFGSAQSNVYADAFSAEALGALETVMQNFRGDKGEILDVTPDTIVIPNQYALKSAVYAAVGSDRVPGSDYNDANFTYGRFKVIVWPYLNQYITAGTAPWILMDSRYNQEYGGAVWLDRVELEVRSELASNDANEWKGYARFTAGFNDWRFAVVGGVEGGSTL